MCFFRHVCYFLLLPMFQHIRRSVRHVLDILADMSGVLFLPICVLPCSSMFDGRSCMFNICTDTFCAFSDMFATSCYFRCSSIFDGRSGMFNIFMDTFSALSDFFATSHVPACLMVAPACSDVPAQVLQQSCWQAPCGEVGRVGQAARAGSLEKDRPGQDYDATLFPNRQHAEPLNMQPLFFATAADFFFCLVCPVWP